MGFNTTVIVLNDALGDIEKDKEFGKKLADAIRSLQVGKRVDVSAMNHGNAASVIETHHANVTTLVAVGGNYATQLGSFWVDSHHNPGDGLKILKIMAEQMGFRLRKR